MTYDELSETQVPFWVENDLPEPSTVFGALYMDRVGGPGRLETVWRRWRELIEQRLTPLFGPQAPAVVLSERLAADEPRAWADRFDTSGAAVLSQLGGRIEAFGSGAYAYVSVDATLGADSGRLDEVVEAVATVLREAAGDVDPAYGELGLGGGGNPPQTALDLALRRTAEESAAAARRALRGYRWVTICPAELATGVDRDSGAFAESVVLPGGALWLQATPLVDGWSQDAARSVFRALASVLPDGLAQPPDGARLSRIVFADAAAVRAGQAVDLPVGQAPLPEPGPERIAALSEWVSDAMNQGWLVMEPTPESAPPLIQCIFPAEAGMTLTPEGQQALAERLGADLNDEPTNR